MFSFFPIVKMNANYAEISRVGNKEACFNKFHLFVFFFCFFFFSEISETSVIQIQQRKVKIFS